jgi:CRP-like cAMP-binding protein
MIPKPAINELLERHPEVGMKLLAVISKELKAAENRLCAQTDKNAAERVAEAVLFLREKFPTQNWTRKEISEWAGTTPETVMRTLADFEGRGLIEQVGRKINIVNKGKMLEEANLVH